MIGASEDEGAIQLDLYLDRVLAGDATPGSGRLMIPADAHLAHTAGLVARGSTRFHPSFRFEERLAARLRDVASGETASGDGRVTTGIGVVVPFVPGGAAAERARSRRVGGVFVGGAIASGVSIASLAGAAALVAWRRARWERLV